MNESKNEELEELEELETEIPDEDIVGAIEDELDAVSDEPEPTETDDLPAAEESDEPTPDAEPEPTPEPEPEPEKDAEPEKDPEPEPDPEPEKPPAETKPSDEFGTLEEDTPKKTRERFETLKGRYDDVVTERDTVQADAQQWKDSILGTGTNPEQFGMTLTYLTKVNSGKPEDLQEAYTIMEGELTALGKMIGRPAPGGYSPLNDHADLKQRVDDGLLDESDALEIAQARATAKLTTTNNEQAQVAADRNNAMEGAKTELTQLSETLKQTDPYYTSKMKLMEPIIETIVQAAPNNPAAWPQAIKRAYESLPNIAATPPTPKPSVPDTIRPTGASPSSGGMDKEPGSAVEAIDLALSRGY